MQASSAHRPGRQPWWNPQQPSGMPVHRYRRAEPDALLAPGTRTWLDRQATHAPLWSSVDLRDGNQALANPMDHRRKLAMFDLLIRLGFKDIEVGYPAASEVEFDFVRRLVTGGHIPDDVTVSVFTPARPELIDRTFEAVRGADRAIVHLCHATSCLWREVVFRMTPGEVMALAEESARRLVKLADEADGDVRFEYSPETFNVTEPEFALEIANTVAEIVDATPDRPLTLNLPSTVEMHAPNVFADQVEWMHRNLDRRDSIILSVHPHNDRGTAVAAAEFALAAGADRVEGTLFGNGERTGNVCLVTLALNLFSRGIDPQLDLSDLATVRRTVEECNEMPVPERHPYAGGLVFTAFSGTHQDAIAKGLAHLDAQAVEAGVPAAELPWDVPYLPVDPQDLGRSYEGIIRVNSQSGKGGMAHVLRTRWGLDVPAELRVEFARVVQRITEETGAEVAPDSLWDTFRTEYCDMGGWAGFPLCEKDSSDPVAALVDAARARGARAEMRQLVRGTAGRATGATHAAYAQLLVTDQPVWGVGLGDTSVIAAAHAILSALHRGGERADAPASGPAPVAYVELAPGRFREDSGLRYEDYVVGHVFEHRPGRTVTTTDNIWGSLLCHNQHPLHIDHAYAAETQFREPLMSSLVTFGIVNGMTVRTISQQAVANLGWDKVRLSAPVFVGDTLYAETTIIAKRPSVTRAGEGIVTVHTIGRNQDGTKVIEFDRTLLAAMREDRSHP